MPEERRIVTIDDRIFKNKEHILRYIADELDFPDYFGLNYDALNDCLSDVYEPTTLRFLREGEAFSSECVKITHQIASLIAEWNPDLAVETEEPGPDSSEEDWDWLEEYGGGTED
ncbi:MAG: barstar family protein [Firmicutes bacterium]|nr:barstar family protein [Bacillota bacterium]